MMDDADLSTNTSSCTRSTSTRLTRAAACSRSPAKGRPVDPGGEALAALGVPFALLTGGARAELDDPVLSGMPCLVKPYLPEELEHLLLARAGPIPGRAGPSRERCGGHGATRR